MFNCDIYDTLPTTNLCEEKVRIQNNLLKDHVQTLECDIKKLYSSLTELKSLQYNLIRNVGELCSTVKVETEHKDRTIHELRAQLGQCAVQRRHCREHSPPWGRPQTSREDYHRLNDQNFCLNKSVNRTPFKETYKQWKFRDRSGDRNQLNDRLESHKMFGDNKYKFDRRRSSYRDDIEKEKMYNMVPTKDNIEHNQKRDHKSTDEEPVLVEPKVRKKSITIQDYQIKMARKVNEESPKFVEKKKNKFEEAKIEKPLVDCGLKKVDVEDKNHECTKNRKEIGTSGVQSMDEDEKCKFRAVSAPKFDSAIKNVEVKDNNQKKYKSNDKQDDSKKKTPDYEEFNTKNQQIDVENPGKMEKVAQLDKNIIIEALEKYKEKSPEKHKKTSGDYKTKNKKAKDEKPTKEKVDKNTVTIEIKKGNNLDKKSKEELDGNKLNSHDKEEETKLDHGENKIIKIPNGGDKTEKYKIKPEKVKSNNTRLITKIGTKEIAKEKEGVTKPVKNDNNFPDTSQKPNETDVKEPIEVKNNKQNVTKMHSTSDSKTVESINSKPEKHVDKSKEDKNLQPQKTKKRKKSMEKVGGRLLRSNSKKNITTKDEEVPRVEQINKNVASKCHSSSTVYLTHNGDIPNLNEIPVLHITENEHINSSILTEMLKEDLNLSNEDITTSTPEEKPNSVNNSNNFVNEDININPPRKRRRVIMTFDD